MLANLGSAGVYVFFVISGFAVSVAWRSKLSDSRTFANYIGDRFARILPLYYFWIALAIASGGTSVYWQERYGVEIDTGNVILHLLLLGTIEPKITNSILGVEWTLSIEFVYYLAIPILFAACGRRRFQFLLVVLGVAAWVGLRILFQSQYPEIDYQLILFTPFPYLLSFVLGVAAAHNRLRKPAQELRGDWPSVVAIGWVLLWIFGSDLLQISLGGTPILDSYIWVSFLSALLITFSDSKSTLTWVLFSNPIANFFGTLSYGLYLSHFVLLNLFTSAIENELLRFAVTLATSSLVSIATWIFLEWPILELRKRWRGHQ